MSSFLLLKKVVIALIFIIYSTISFAAMYNENVHKVKLNKMYFVYKEFKGSLSSSFNKELLELASEFKSSGFSPYKSGIMFAGLKAYTDKNTDLFSNSSYDPEKNSSKDVSYYLKDINPIYINADVLVYVGWIINDGEADENSLSAMGYSFFVLSGSYPIFQISNELYEKNIKNMLINQTKKDFDVYVADMRVRDRVHMLNAMDKINKPFIGMLEIYDSENSVYTFLGYYDNKKEEEEDIKNQAMLEENVNVE